MLELHNLRLPLATFTLALDAVLTARTTAVFGPSGSGKTSLLEMIAGLRQPTAGSIRLQGVRFADAAARKHLRPADRRVGYVPQEGALFPHLTVEGNLRYGLVEATDREWFAYDHVVEVLELEPLVDRPISSLSGGEQQRVALGRALLRAPGLLLLDEPLSGLDDALKDRVMSYLIRVRDEFAIPTLLVSHSADEVMTLCDEVLVLDMGRLIEQGAPAKVFVDTGRRHFRYPAE